MAAAHTGAKKRYFFLDSWALSEYSTPRKSAALVSYMATHDYLPVVNSLSLTELFNPGWANAPGVERGERTTSLIADLACSIVDPVVVIRAELRSYPDPLPRMPIQLDLSLIGNHVRREVLLRFLRSDPLFLAQGRDVRKWAASYAAMKQKWSDSLRTILDDAVRKGLLLEDGPTYRFPTPVAREDFLLSLDRRLLGVLDADEWRALGRNLIDLTLGATRQLPSVRLSSLLFLHTYVEVPSNFQRRVADSDLGDLFHLWIATYCSVVTADTSMKRVLERLRSEAKLSCDILDPNDLRTVVS